MAKIYCTDLPNIMHETIDGETVVVNLDSGIYYSFDGVSGRIWDLLGGEGRGLGSLSNRLTSLYIGEESRIEAAAAAFVARLEAEGLVRVTEGEDRIESEGAIPADPFTDPLLQKYTDMEALLLADPIHEVDEAGWPNLA